ncbi:MAG: MATE family efflux transporter [Chlamydiota bacterium]
MEFLLQIPSRYKTIFSAYLSRAIILLCKFITVPILLLYLPREEYAVLVILGGLEGWFFLLDFGMGSSVQNTLAENEVTAIEEGPFLKTTFLISLCSLIVGAFFLYQLSPILSSFFLHKIGPIENLREVFLLVGCFFILGTWGSIGGKVLLARQKGYQMYLVQSAAHLISLSCIVSFGFLGKLSLSSALIFSLGIPSVASCLLAIKVFYKVSWSGSFQWDMLKRARGFWLFAIMAALVSLSDSVIITKTLSIEGIIEYNLLCKIFGVASFAYAAFIQALMPECSQQLLMGKVREVEQTVYKHCFIGILGVLLFTCFVLGLSPFIERAFHISLGWIGIGAFSLYLATRVIADFYAMALQSHSKLTSFFYLVPIQAVLSLSLQYFLSLKFGITGILLGLALSYALTVCWALPRQLRQLRYG